MKGSVNKMKHTYIKPTLQKVELAANDILLASGEVNPGEYEARGALNTFDITSERYQYKNWSDLFYN